MRVGEQPIRTATGRLGGAAVDPPTRLGGLVSHMLVGLICIVALGVTLAAEGTSGGVAPIIVLGFGLALFVL